MIRYTANAFLDFIRAEVSNEYLRAVRETCLRVERFKSIGSPVAGNPGIHVFRHEDHKIYYAIEGDDVLVVRFLHEKRRVPKRIR